MIPAMVESMEVEDEVEGIAATCGYLTQILEVIKTFGDDGRRYMNEAVFMEMLHQLANICLERLLRRCSGSGDATDDTTESSTDNPEAWIIVSWPNHAEGNSQHLMKWRPAPGLLAT